MPHRTGERDNSHRLIVANDLVRAGIAVAGATTARFLPGHRADGVRDRLATLARRLRPGKWDAVAAKYRATVGADAPEMPDSGSYLRGLVTMQIGQDLAYYRLAADPAWRPAVTTSGIDAVEGAAAGQGVVLWAMPLTYGVLLLHLTAHDRGWPMGHLSQWNHGPSSTLFGRTFLNPGIVRVDESLVQRLVIPPEGATATLARAGEKLARGEMVSVRGLHRGRRAARYPCFTGAVDLALGAPVLALRSGARLVSVAPRLAGDDRFTLHFERLDRDGDDDAVALGARFAALMEVEIRRSPTLWPLESAQWTATPEKVTNRAARRPHSAP
jgi:hypothetical protein